MPLPSAVLLPGTVATLTLETEDARAAVAAARAGDGRVVVVPELEGRRSRVGVIAQVEQVGQLPTGAEAAILRAVQRAVLAAEVVSERAGRWQEVEPLPEGRPSPRVEALRPRAASGPGGGGHAAPITSAARDPADHRGRGSAQRRRDRVVRSVRRPPAHRAGGHGGRGPGGAGAGLGQGPPGRAQGQRGTSARTSPKASRSSSASTSCASSWPRSARSWARTRTPRTTTAPASPSWRSRPRFGSRSRRRSTGWSATSGQSPEQGWIRTWLDRVLDLPWGSTTPENIDLVRGAGRPRRRSLRPRRRQGPHHRAAGRPQAPPRAGPRRRR